MSKSLKTTTRRKVRMQKTKFVEKKVLFIFSLDNKTEKRPERKKVGGVKRGIQGGPSGGSGSRGIANFRIGLSPLHPERQKPQREEIQEGTGQNRSQKNAYEN